MAENFLTQDEVDALLNFENGSKHQQTAQKENEVSYPGGVRPYNMATQERIVRGRMPALEIINARFANSLQIGLYNFLRRGWIFPPVRSKPSNTANSPVHWSSRRISTWSA